MRTTLVAVTALTLFACGSPARAGNGVAASERLAKALAKPGRYRINYTPPIDTGLANHGWAVASAALAERLGVSVGELSVGYHGVNAEGPQLLFRGGLKGGGIRTHEVQLDLHYVGVPHGADEVVTLAGRPRVRELAAVER